MRGLIVDFGGVLTTNVFQSFMQFAEAEGLPPDTIKRAFKEDREALALLRRLETGDLTAEEFEPLFAERIGVSGDRVEQLLEHPLVVLEAGAPRVRDQPGLHAPGAGTPHGVEHPILGPDAREQPPDEALDAIGGQADPLGESRLEVLHRNVAALELAQQRERLRVLAKRPLHGQRVEPLRLPERPERVEDVGGEDPAEVDEQALHAVGAGSFVISCAASASCGTPSSKNFRYGSSVVPASDRL